MYNTIILIPDYNLYIAVKITHSCIHDRHYPYERCPLIVDIHIYNMLYISLVSSGSIYNMH